MLRSWRGNKQLMLAGALYVVITLMNARIEQFRQEGAPFSKFLGIGKVLTLFPYIPRLRQRFIEK